MLESELKKIDFLFVITSQIKLRYILSAIKAINEDSVMWVIPYLPIYLRRQYSFCFLITNKNLASCENENKCFALSF